MELENWQIQLRKGILELVVLNLLYCRKRHGYEMVQILKNLQGLSIREGNIYPILARLQMEGLVTSSQQASTDGPPRKYFTLTDKGIQVRDQMNSLWLEIVTGVQSTAKDDTNE